MKVRWTPRAVEDLKTISRYIGRNDPAAARQFADKLQRRAESVRRFPNRGRTPPEVDSEDIRELIEGNYRIVYRVLKDAVHILTLFEGYRLADDPDRED